MAQGDFSASQLLKVKLKAEQMWSDGQFSAELKPEAEAARAVLLNQTARISALEVSDKDNSVVINWMNTCDIVEEDCETNCLLDENELESMGKQYDLDICKKTGFSIDAEKIRTNDYTFEEMAAKGTASAVKTLDEYWGKVILAKLQSFAGVNVAPSPFVFNPATNVSNTGGITGTALVPRLIQQAIQNRIRNSYLISDGTAGDMYYNWLQAKFNSGDFDGKGDEARAQALKIYFDLFNFGAAGIGADMFLIGTSAVAMTTKVRHTEEPRLIGGQVQQTLYTVNSNILPNVKYDVYYGITCKTVNGKSHYYHTWRFETNGGVFLNPQGCPVTVGGTSYEPTGVLAYELGDGVTV